MSRTVNQKTFFICTFLLSSVFLLQGCGKKDSSGNAKGAEKPVPAGIDTRKTELPPPTPEKLPPPTMKDVEAALHRVFQEDVTIDHDFKPAFIVGDFNGDEVEDLAVVVRPVSAKLADINNDLANWILQDADKFFIAPPNARVVKMPKHEPVKVEKGDQLLAVIHGFGGKGWRNPDARQAYLVRHAAVHFLGTSRSFSEKAIRDMKLNIQTDLIQADRNSKRGFLFWTGSNYAWHGKNG